ncbi:hypothetical protein [Butyrivibrio proteoclasticus]|uniref:hypothetical protein n=1 Tax=Butyrivibrio proteoclasticus TaxID=43305 RepID=UPI00047D9DA4|nr:hypothetical protein [Butyrivibrio proteoclasticus]
MSEIKYHVGDITRLQVDAIVNAAKIALLTVKEWIGEHADYEMEVTIVCFSEGVHQSYRKL